MIMSMLAVVGCVPHLYSEDSGGDTTWEAPENSWSSKTPPSGLAPEGFDEGDVVFDLRGLDQFGDEVSLWQFYGSLVVLDISTQWCAPCQDLARGAQETVEHDQGDDVVYLTLLGEDTEGESSTSETCEQWADAFGIEAPIITDPSDLRKEIVDDGSYPRVMIIGRDLRVEITEIENPTDPKIRSAIDELL